MFLHHIPIESGNNQDAFVSCLNVLILQDKLFSQKDFSVILGALLQRIHWPKLPSMPFQDVLLSLLKDDQSWNFSTKYLQRNIQVLFKHAARLWNSMSDNDKEHLPFM